MNNKIETAEILCVGTELLLGDIVNTNASFLSSRLAELGISVYRHVAVGDNPARLAAALRDSLAHADLVITSGGLGPTYDDLTKETVASVFGRELYMHEESLATIRSYFSRTGRVMTKNNEKQAMTGLLFMSSLLDFLNIRCVSPCIPEVIAVNKSHVLCPFPRIRIKAISDSKVFVSHQDDQNTIIQ